MRPRPFPNSAAGMAAPASHALIIFAECGPGPSAGDSESKTALAVFFEDRQRFMRFGLHP